MVTYGIDFSGSRKFPQLLHIKYVDILPDLSAIFIFEYNPTDMPLVMTAIDHTAPEALVQGGAVYALDTRAHDLVPTRVTGQEHPGGKRMSYLLQFGWWDRVQIHLFYLPCKNMIIVGTVLAVLLQHQIVFTVMRSVVLYCISPKAGT